MPKSQIDEIFSFVRFSAPDPDKYFVIYQDLDDLMQVTVPEFLELVKTVPIPTHRIRIIKKEEKNLFVRYGYCSGCGNKLPKQKETNEWDLCQNPICPDRTLEW